jgi:predicted DNA-binding transcriptional regulator AlpA
MEELLTEKQAAQLLGVKPKTLSDWRWRGGGPRFIKLGGFCRYQLSDLSQWIEGQKRRSTSDVPANRTPAEQITA